MKRLILWPNNVLKDPLHCKHFGVAQNIQKLCALTMLNYELNENITKLELLHIMLSYTVYLLLCEHKSWPCGLTLAQVMARCVTASSRQHWWHHVALTSKQLHSEGNACENHTLMIITTFPRGQWVICHGCFIAEVAIVGLPRFQWNNLVGHG